MNEQHPDLRSLRHDYAARGLDEAELTPDPLDLFDRWFAEALEAGLGEPNAMVVATVDAGGRPSARTVLLKERRGGGLVFFTNHASRKGEELAANPHVALLFPWHDLERNVRFEGVAEPLPRAEVEDYFAVRPRGSQLGAHASRQSSVVADRAELERSYADAEERFADQDVPPPASWGGYLVRPDVVEFWQGRPSRLHDRLVYRFEGGAWRTERLAP
ncbi:pyridoxamine 5'-phosphate oxidase [Nocardioides bruguierae]|uniref:pyridoxamine 5'-phosphate oxidase n=1 Tax=Nocardioides bruguierae TaxID=2945102 RepID=UPI002021F682|nr:pyridoxamine 5'-phosphate oxidase [Nocardioides bruguierae]MCL8024612.1 pyridoxamine 5'-phosphate oxidase [Nocardioides bruguierae]